MGRKNKCAEGFSSDDGTLKAGAKIVHRSRSFVSEWEIRGTVILSQGAIQKDHTSQDISESTAQDTRGMLTSSKHLEAQILGHMDGQRTQPPSHPWSRGQDIFQAVRSLKQVCQPLA